MNKKTPRKSGGPRPASSGPKLSSSDEDALDLFCESFDFEDINLQAWSQSLRSLDILLDLPITSQEALAGGQSIVHFVRKIRSHKSSSFHKSPVDRTVVWPSNSQNAQIISYPKEGDFNGNAKGDLKIKIRVKN